MAPISKFFTLLFFTTLSFSLQINARDSQFFSKVTHVNNNNNVKDTDVPNYEQPLNKPEQQQPVFIPETENSYGLYGHESGLHPPTTTTTNNVDPNTYQSYKTSSEDETNNVNNYYSYQKDSYSTKYPNEISDTKLTGTSYTNNNNFNYNNNKVSSNEFSNTKFPEEGYNFMDNNNNDNNNMNNKKFPEEGYNSAENYQNNNKKFYYNNNVAANDKYYFKSNAANNNYNGERQGMSDTRVMEGGKYFYDVNLDQKYNPTFNGGSSKEVNSENWNNNKGYFGNNNVNNYESNKSSMNGYQNQEEFEDDQEEFEP